MHINNRKYVEKRNIPEKTRYNNEKATSQKTDGFGPSGESSNSRPLEPHFMKNMVRTNALQKKHRNKPFFIGLLSVLLV